MAGMTIGKLAAAGEVGVETIRYYQRRGLLDTPERPDSYAGGSVRRYTDEDLRRLRFIRSAQSAGFTLDQIGELLCLDSRADRPRARELAEQRLRALDSKIAELQTVRNALAHLAKSCASGSAGPCPILTAFEEMPHAPAH